MQQLMQPFNPMDFDPEMTGGLPVGRHPVVISAGEIKPTKENDGGLLELTLTAIDGPSKGASQKYRLNLYNKSPQSVEIANRQLSALCHVTGVFQLGADGRTFQALFNIPFSIEIAKQKNDEKYTEVAAVFDINGNPPKKAGTGAARPAPTAAPGAPAAGGWGGPQQGQQQPQGGAPAAGGWGAPQQGQQQPQQPNQAAAGWGAPGQQQQQQQPQQGAPGGQQWGGPGTQAGGAPAGAQWGGGRPG